MMPDETSPESLRIAARNLIIVQQFTRAMVRDPALMEEVPKGVTLVLLPDDQPDLAEVNLRAGLESARAGRNVYLRHVYRQHAVAGQPGEITYSPYPTSDVGVDS